MRKLSFIVGSLLLTAVTSACWFTVENFDHSYIAGANNYCAHFNQAETFSSAVYYNGGSVSLPLTLYVKVTPRTSDQQTIAPVLTAVLQYKAKHNGVWSSWVTVKTISSSSGSVTFPTPTTLFGRNSICPRGLVAGDEIMVRLYVTDGIYESGSLSVDPGDIPNTATPSSGGTYNGGWTAPFVFRMTFNGKYWR